MFQRKTRCTGPRLGTRTVVQFCTTYVNHAECELSACFETYCISVHFVCFCLRIFEVRTTHSMKPGKFPETGQKGSAKELILLGKLITYSLTLEANEQRCLNHVRRSPPKHAQRNLYCWSGKRVTG